MKLIRPVLRNLLVPMDFARLRQFAMNLVSRLLTEGLQRPTPFLPSVVVKRDLVVGFTKRSQECRASRVFVCSEKFSLLLVWLCRMRMVQDIAAQRTRPTLLKAG